MKKILTVVLFFSMVFVGRAAGKMVSYIETASGKVEEAENWGLGFGQEGTKPTGNVSSDALAEYDAFYVGDGEEKVIYLTFDCGYENGNTEPILDALKKHNVPATFFVVGHFLETAPELVKRMVTYGGKSYLPSPGYVKDFGSCFFQKGDRGCGKPVSGDHGHRDFQILQAASGKIQHTEFTDGEGTGISHFFLEPCLCGLVSG